MSRFDDSDPNPMRVRVRDGGLDDAWRGARIGSRARAAARRAASRFPAQIDIGQPGSLRVIPALVALAGLVTAWEFATYGLAPTVPELDRAGGLSVIALARGDWSAALVANLLHGGVAHVLLNAFVLVLMGRWLEHLLGSTATLAVVLWSALAASVGAVLAAPHSVTVGASGIAFGLVGAGIAADPRARTPTGVVARSLVLVNLIGTFLVPGISIGGHLGGLAAGLVVGRVAFDATEGDERPAGAPRRRLAHILAASAAVVVLGLACWHAVDPDSAQRAGEDVALRVAR